MKKLKIMLMSALVVAIVGGALAFKAKGTFFLYCTDDTNQACVDLQPYNVTFSSQGISHSFCDITTHLGGEQDPCPFVKVTDTN